MFKVTKLISFRPDAAPADRDQIIDRIGASTRDLPQIARSQLAPTGEGIVNGGDLIWHLQFRDEPAYRACLHDPAWRAIEDSLGSYPVGHVDGVTYGEGTCGIREPGIRNGIHRTLLLAVRPFVAVEDVARFEAEMREMARYVPAIRNWGFSRVVEATGSRRWTHVWEQEFQNVGDLFGPYMMHPIHFAHIDRWFDTQSHDWIVDTHLCHTYCDFDASMLAPMT